MYMMKNKFLVAVALMALSTMTFAKGNGGTPPPFNGGSGDTTSNSDAVAVGVGIGKGGSANVNSSNTNTNAIINNNSVKSNNSNTNRNDNRSSANANQGQGQSVDINDSSTIVYEDNYRAPATAFAPALTTGVCMGSASAAFGNQYFSLGGGKTTIDEECQIRYNSIRLEQVGQVNAATLILCQVESTKTALEQSGFNCPDEKPFSKENTSHHQPMWQR